jgi:protein-L-isoaspartate(D-aspartate) O-methyltransferase
MSQSERADELRLRLAQQLADRGVLGSPGWCSAFQRVPRHLFVPRYHRTVNGERRLVDGSRPEDREEWLAGAYSDEPLVTGFDAQNPTAPNSSSSMPALMALMLEWLVVEEGSKVLEIGTGTGYNAALLCERLGSHRVTTIDVDPDCVEAARDHLMAAGYSPRLAVADGWHGYADEAPYDRIIATCAAHRLPDAWVEQLAVSGVIVAIVSTGIVRARLMEHGDVVGRFHAAPVRYMSMRGGAPAPPPTREVMALTSGEGDVRATRHPWEIVDDDAFWFFCRLVVLPFCVPYGAEEEYDRLIDVRDGSWARRDALTDQVTQGGRRRVWDLVEQAYDDWRAMGRPGRERLGLTVTSDRRHHAWLDTPGSEHVRELPR